MSPTLLPHPELPAPVAELLAGQRREVVLGEAFGSAAALLLAAIAEHAPAPLLAVVARESDAEDLELDVSTLAPDLDLSRLPELGVSDPHSPEGRRNRSEREVALHQIRGSAKVIVASLAAVAGPAPDPASEAGAQLKIATGSSVDRAELRRVLYSAGLEAAPLVEGPGQVSVRGDIIDFHLFGQSAPVRIEMFDDDVESIREFDPETQRSSKTLQSVLVHSGSTLLQSAGRFCALDHFVTKPVFLRVDPVAQERVLRPEGESADAELLQIETRLLQLARIDLHPEFAHMAQSQLGAGPAEGSLGIDDLGRWGEALPEEVKAVHLFSSTTAEGRRLTRLLRSRLPSRPRRKVVDHLGSLHRGFCMPSLGIWAGNHHELLSRTRLRRVEAEKRLPTRAIKEALELSEGDFVVHQTHGVALYRGMQEHSHRAGTEDYLILEFLAGTLLYVPASKMEMVSRFVGPGGTAPKLDKMGGRSWARKKENVRAAIDDLAKDLLELHALRKSRPGHAFEPDDDVQAEFDASFPFADTPDQTSAIEEIKRDMESPKVMDRLVCGDVGFGKTELAVRAAFKAAIQGRQVAILAPTTLLVRQHLETFRNRMANYPLRVEALSRLTARKKTGETLAGLADGSVDVVIGSHRLLSKKVRFRDLALLVIDEEQRFGVKHKETLKALKKNVDVLTLSATPIPRTLHMALVGLRDVSTLRHPPRGRQPVKTTVTYFDPDLVRSAIEQELAREGQVFYLFNRVQGIQGVASRVQELAPRARVGVAHGQLPARELERTASRFAAGEFDVLVCTTIIESGIDIPRVNTLIVDRSDRMGLADLHQLRGRIGRSARQAYAFFLIPQTALPAIALKRLRALEGLSHLGAGFDIAIRDLEIRGAGNLLGREQSGQIASVGYDLYCQMLAKVVAERQGRRPPAEPEEIDLTLGLPAFLPREYVHSTHQRMGLLRRLGEARQTREIDTMAEEIVDRYGRLPKPAAHLLDMFRLKRACARAGIHRVFYNGGGEVLLNVRDLRRFNKIPMGEAEARWVEGSRVHLILPPTAMEPERALTFLLKTLRP